MKKTLLLLSDPIARRQYVVNFLLALALMLGISMQQSLQAQIPVTVSGTAVTSPALFSSYPDLATALSALNAITSYTTPGTIIFTCAAGSSETAPPTGFVIGSATLNPLLSATNTVTINKSGGTVTINAGVGTATPTSAAPDGMISIRGADYITIDGLTLTDGNTTNPSTMEFGIALFKASLSDGAQNNTIKNCIINMQRINNASSTSPMIEGAVGILVVNSTATTATTSLTPTTVAGTNSGNKFYTNTINGGNYGIGLSGFAATTPFTAGDTGNDIGGSSLATGNTILNYGGGAATNPAAGIRANNQWGVNISYNTVNNNDGSGVNHATTLRGIYAQAGTSANATINNNTVTLQSGATTSACTAIDNGIGSTAASNTVSINNNTINVNYSTATSGVYTGINNSATAAILNMNGNIITAVSGGVLAGTGTHVMMETGSPVTVNVNNNTIQNITRNGASGSWRGIKTTSPTNLTVTGNTVENLSWTNTTSTGSIDGFYSLSSAVNVTVSNNIIRNLSTPTTGTLNGIREFGVSGTKTIQNNQVYSFSTTVGGVGGATMNGIFCSTGNIEVSNNRVYSLNSTGTTGGTAGTIYGIQISGGTTNTIFKNSICDLSSTSTNPIVAGITVAGGTTNTISNNRIGDLRTPAANAANPLIGINITSGTTANVYYNTVSLNGTSTGALFGSSAISASTTPTLTLNNNIFVNNSTANSTGVTAAYRRSSTTLTTYTNASDRNDFFAPTLFFDGTNNITTLAAYKTFMASPRDANSINENPPFLSTACGNGNFLKVNTAIATGVESGGANITGVTDDFENDIRFGNPGYTGTGTAPDIGADEFNGTPLPICAGTPTASTITGLASVCSGTGTTLSLSTTYSEIGITYQWASSTTPGGPYTNLGTGATQTTGNLTVPTYYICTISCAFGSSFTTTEKSVLVNPTPTASAGNNGPVCPGSTLNLSATTDIGTTFAWSGPNSFSSTAQNPGITGATGSAAGTYTVTVTSGGCSATASTAVTVSAPVSASATATPTTICNNGSSQLNAVGGTTSAYTMSATTFGLLTATGTVTNTAIGDDALLNTVAMPFSFSFFGNTYSNILIYSNGYVAFQTGVTGSPYVQTIPDVAAPNNFIAISHDDLNVTATGQMSYFTNGTAPNRIFVINYNGVKYYNTAANNGNLTGQIQIFEADQHIEIHVQNSVDPVLSAKSLGIENAAGTVGNAPASRNNLSYDITTPEAWGFFPSGGTLTYAWSESPASPTTLAATNIANPTASSITVAKTYTVTITETVTGCSNTASVVVTPSAPISAATITPASPAFCTGGSVTLTATPSNGGAPFTYAWAGPGGPAGTSATQVANVGGTWTVTVTDNCGGSVVVNKTVTENAIPTATAGSNSPVCAGSALNLNVTTNIGTTFAWAGPNTYTSMLQNPSITSATTAATGTYTVTVTSAAGCSATSSTPVTVNVSPVITSVTATPGTICAGQNSQLQVNLPAPAAYCTASATSTSFEKIGNVTVANINNTSTATAGYEDFTSVTGNVVAGTGYPLSILVTGAYASDDRILIWIDANQDGVFQDPGELVYTAAISTFCLACSGTDATVTGTLNIPVSTANGNTRMRIRMHDNSTGGNTTPCGTSTYGQVEDYTLNVSGGVSAYTYSWSPVTYLNNPAIANPLASAVMATTPYTVTVTNGGGCTATGSVTVTANPLVTAGTISGTNPLCLGATAIFTSNGTAGGTWSSNNTGVATVDPTSGLVTAVAQGPATITYTVNTGCGSPVSATYNVNVNAFDFVNLQFPNSATICQGGTFSAYGQVYELGLTEAAGPGAGIVAELGISQGAANTNPNTWTNWVVAPFNVQFGNNDEYWATTGASLTPGTYYYAFRYTYPGCAGVYQYGGIGGPWNGTTNVSGVLTVNGTTAFIGNNTGTTVISCTNPSISLTATGGGTYAWSGGLGTAANATVTTAGTYTVTVTGTGGCQDTASITITGNSTPPTAGITNNTGATELTCTTTGISLTATGGGTYAWSGGLGTAAGVTVTTAGTYTVTVTGTNSCTATASVTITSNTTPPTAGITNNTSTTELTCTTTSISLTATGGGTYAWDGGLGTAANATVTTAGTYTVTVTGTNGCTATASIVVSSNTTPTTAGITNNTSTTELTCTTTSISLTATGGASYVWDGGLGNAANATVTAAGTYTVTVTGANGCTATASVTITSNTTPPPASITPTPSDAMITCTNTSVALQAQEGTGYLWSNGETTSLISVSVAGTYTVTVTGSNGCTNTASVVVGNTPCSFTFNFGFFDPCSCNNDATVAANDGTFNEVSGVPFVSQNGSVPADFEVTVLSSTGTTGLPNGTVLTYNALLSRWETPTFTHTDNIGYNIVFEVRAAAGNQFSLPAGQLLSTVTGGNKCAYPNPVVSGLSGTYCTSASGGVPDTDITAILTGSPSGPVGFFTISGTDISGGPVTYTFTPPAAVGTSTVSGSYTGGFSGTVSSDGGTTPAFPGCIQPFSTTTNVVDCPPGCNASPIMQWNDN